MERCVLCVRIGDILRIPANLLGGVHYSDVPTKGLGATEALHRLIVTRVHRYYVVTKFVDEGYIDQEVSLCLGDLVIGGYEPSDIYWRV